jgi:hypothetical protein
MRRRVITLVTTIALLMLSVVGPAMATPPGNDDGHKITICHVTNSASNPFVVITIDVAAWHAEGQVGHSPDHHVNHKTGDHDVVWDEVDGCGENGDGGGPGPT